MPVISYFFGIYVRMYHDDHEPSHVPVAYQGHEALVDLQSGSVMAGGLPKKAQRLSGDWCAAHHGDLMENWQRAKALSSWARCVGQTGWSLVAAVFCKSRRMRALYCDPPMWLED